MNNAEWTRNVFAPRRALVQVPATQSSASPLDTILNWGIPIALGAGVGALVATHHRSTGALVGGASGAAVAAALSFGGLG